MNMRPLGLAVALLFAIVIEIGAVTVAENISRTPAVPYETIQAAIDGAVSGETILVYPGTHYGMNTIFNKSLNLVSKYYLDGNIAWRDQTILDGNATGGVINLRSNSDTNERCRIIGFTIRNAKDVPAIQSSIEYFEFKRCIIEDNVNSLTSGTSCFLKTSVSIDGLFEDVIIRNNTSVYNPFSQYGIDFSGNSNYQHRVTLRNVKITGNNIYHLISTLMIHLTMENVEICNNNLNHFGYVLYVEGDRDVFLNHCTFAGNGSNEGISHDINICNYNNQTSSKVIIFNSIIWDDMSEDHFTVYVEKINTFVLKNTAVKGNGAYVFNLIDVAQNTISVVPIDDPLFSINTSNDYELSNNSPCLGKGIVTTVTKDIRGVQRPPIPRGTVPDLGAYENLSNDNVTGSLNLTKKVLYSSINEAISGASDFDTIIALEGTHAQTVNLSKSLTLASSYILTGDTSSISKTVLDGQGNHQPVVCEQPGDNNHQVIGLTIKNGFSLEKFGGGLYTSNQKSLVTRNCVFEGNFAFAGSALYSANTEHVWIENCIFRNNNGPASLIGVNDVDHPTTHGTTLRNVLLHNNTTAAELIVLKSADIDHITCVNNTFGTINKYALYASGINVDVNNSIFWNTGSDYVFLWGQSNNRISNSNVRGGSTFIKTGSGGTVTQSNIISANPSFVNTYHLSNSSPCIGTGGMSPVLQDLDGNMRSGKNADMGCYENPSGQSSVARNMTKGIEYPTISSAIDGASNNDVILIYPGVHKGLLNFDVPQIGISLISMFTQTGDSGYISSTILDGENKGRTILFSSYYNSSIDGFTIRGGYASEFGAAIYGPSFARIAVKNCIIENNNGSAIIYSSEEMVLENTLIRNNMAEKILWCRNSKADVMNCRITNNTGIPFHACVCPVTTQFTGVRLRNVLIDNNSADRFINIEAQPVELNHVVVVNNSYLLSPIGCKSLFVDYQPGKACPFTIKNTVFWNPASPKELHLADPTSITINNTVVRNGIDGSGNINTPVIGIGAGVPRTISRLMASNPLFVNESNGDFHLLKNSSLIDAGIQSDLTTDLDYNTRPAPGTLPDIGCYEHNYIDTGKNIVPIMTSYTSPWGTVMHSGCLNSSVPGWKAFDGDDASSTSQWISSTNFPAILQFEFPYASPVVRYLIVPEYSLNIERTPKKWDFQGYDESTASWVTLDSRSEIMNSTEWSSRGLSFAVITPGLYKKYRLYIRETNGGSSVAIRDLKLYSPKDVCPIIVSNTGATLKVSSSSEYSTSYAAWKAFDGDDVTGGNSRWISKSVPAWISAEFASPKNVLSYYIQAEYGLNNRAPKNWTLEGWDAATSSWVIIDSRTNILLSTWTFYGQYFKVANPGIYQKYRLSISAVNGSTLVSICKIKFFER